MDTQNISFMVAVTAGLMSFLSPCVLPLLPSYVSFITGMSFEDLTGENERDRIRKTAAIHSILFVAGFSIVFVTLGASATYVGNFMNQHISVFQKAGGGIIMLLGVHFTGVLNFGFLQREKRVHISEKPLGYAGSVLVGIAFALGWTPCIGPILATILLYATTTESMYQGMALLFAYSMGLGIPFILSAMAINTFLSNFRRIAPYMRVVTVISGIFLVGIGLLIFTNNFAMITEYVSNLFSE